MELQHVNVKIYLDGKLTVDPARFIDLFHRWIREEMLPTLLIDVADYRHVPDGPGVMLIGHEADYNMDHTNGQWGLRYNRKAPLEGSNEDRFREAFAAAGEACRLIENDCSADGLRFSRTAFELFVNDRALAPNTADTLAAVQPEIESFLTNVLGQRGFTVEHLDADPRCRFGVSVHLAQPFDLEALSARP